MQIKKIVLFLSISISLSFAVDTTKSTGVTKDGEPRFVILGKTHGAYGSVIYVKNLDKFKDQWRLERLGREKLTFTTTCDQSLFKNSSANCEFHFSNGVKLKDNIRLMK